MEKKKETVFSKIKGEAKDIIDSSKNYIAIASTYEKLADLNNDIENNNLASYAIKKSISPDNSFVGTLVTGIAKGVFDLLKNGIFSRLGIK